MGKEYETRIDATVPAPPEQVWDAIATGPGVTSWYIGRTDIDGSTVRTAFADATMPPSTVTTADQPHRFAHHTGTAPDGRFQAFEFLVEGREGSATVVRAATTGFLPGDDWDDEYEAMSCGTALFFATLVEYLTHFPARTGTPVTAFGPPVDDWAATWAALHDKLGLTSAPRPGDHTRDGGEVFFTNAQTLAIRTPEGLLRYLRGFHGPLIAAHIAFAPDPGDQAHAQALLDSL